MECRFVENHNLYAKLISNSLKPIYTYIINNVSVFQEMVDNISYFTIRPPRDGAYRLTIYVKDTTPSANNTGAPKDGVYGGVCEYQLIRESAPTNQVCNLDIISLFLNLCILFCISGCSTFSSVCEYILGNGRSCIQIFTETKAERFLYVIRILSFSVHA